MTGKLLSLDRMLEPTLPALLALLDVPVDDLPWQSLTPAQRRQEMLDAVKRLLLRESREQPLLVIFEDLHWIDRETQALLDGLVESLGAARLLLLVNYRPEYRHAWSAKTYFSQARLDALPVESVEEFLTALLGDDPGLVPLKQMLVRRGNPFFLEETVRTLVEAKTLVGDRGRYVLTRPIQAIHVPATVQTVIASRIDRLSPDDKRLLQTASVVGREVAFTLLQAITGFADEALHCGLERLQAAEFLYETGLFPDREYFFKHALTHDVTYNALLLERRRELHARIVAAIETLHRDRLAEQTERLAYHAVRGELGEKAHHYLHQAGVKAAGRSALPDARAWFEQALGVLERLAETQAVFQKAFDTRLELRVVLYQVGEVRPALERLREAQRLADRLDDDARRGIAWSFVGNAESMVGNLDEALVATSHAIAVATRLDNLNLLLSSKFNVGLIYYLRGDYERVIELATENLAKIPTDDVLGRFGGSAPLSVQNRYILLMSLAQLGRFPEAAEHTTEVIRLAELAQHPYTIGMAYFSAGMAPLLKGEWAESGRFFDHGISVSTAVNAILLLPPVVAVSAWILAQLGRTADALSRCGEAERLLERQAALGLSRRPWGYHALGRTYLLLDRLDEARRFAVLATESPAYAGFTAHAQHLLGDIESRPDRFDAERSEAHYRHALALAEPRGMRPLIAHCHLGLGKLYGRTDKREQAQDGLATATAMYREMGMTYWLETAEAELQTLR